MSPSSRIAATAAICLLGLSGLAACASSSSDKASSSSSSSSAAPSAPSSSAAPSATASSSDSSSPKAAKTVTISIKDYKFSGASTVAPGTKIIVKNEDTEAHTLTADSGGAFDVQIAPGKSATFKAPSAGSYPYHCTYHADMHGMLKVS